MGELSFSNIGKTIKKASEVLCHIALILGAITMLIGLYLLIFQSSGEGWWFDALFVSKEAAVLEGNINLYNSKMIISAGINLILASFGFLLAAGFGEIVECKSAMKCHMCGEEVKTEENNI